MITIHNSEIFSCKTCSILQNRFCPWLALLPITIATKCYPCIPAFGCCLLDVSTVYLMVHMSQGVHVWLLHGSIVYSWKYSLPLHTEKNRYPGCTSHFGLRRPFGKPQWGTGLQIPPCHSLTFIKWIFCSNGHRKWTTNHLGIFGIRLHSPSFFSNTQLDQHLHWKWTAALWSVCTHLCGCHVVHCRVNLQLAPCLHKHYDMAFVLLWADHRNLLITVCHWSLSIEE